MTHNNSRERKGASGKSGCAGRDLFEIDRTENRRKEMAKKSLVPGAKNALDQFKMQAASEVGVNLTNGYNGDLTSKQAGSVGGQMVKKMIEKYENDIKASK